MEPDLHDVKSRGREAYLLSARDLKHAVDDGMLTYPDINRSCYARIREREPVIRAWVSLPDESTIDLACGIPVGVKDCIDTHDYPTEYGSAAYAGNRPRADADVVTAAKANNLFIAGKTATAEFAFSSPPITANPLDLARTPGGSSSGSAASVAANMVPWSIGTQTGGSIIRPASYCGVVGYKPTLGMISTKGVKRLAPSYDTIGVFARNVDDASLLVSILAEQPSLDRDRQELQMPRYAFLCDLPENVDQAPLERSIACLASRGVVVKKFRLPFDFAEGDHRSQVLVNAEVRHELAHDFQKHGDLFSISLRRLMEEPSACASVIEDHTQRLFQDRLDLVEAMTGIDALLMPAATGQAPVGHSTTGDAMMNRMWSTFGLPCITVPSAIGPQGMPLGLQMVGRPGADADLINAALFVERVLDGLNFHLRCK